MKFCEQFPSKGRLPCTPGIGNAPMSFLELEKYLSILEDKSLTPLGIYVYVAQNAPNFKVCETLGVE